MDGFEAIQQALVDDESNAAMTQLGWRPLFATMTSWRTKRERVVRAQCRLGMPAAA